MTQFAVIKTPHVWSVTEDFETNADWTPVNCTVEDDTTHVHSGSKSQKMTTDSGATTRISKTVSYDLAHKSGAIKLWVYVEDMSKVSWAYLYFSTDTGMGANKGKGWAGGASGNLNNGWNLLVTSVSELRVAAGSGGMDATQVRLWLRVIAVSGQVAVVSFDSLSIDHGASDFEPCVMFDFDDQRSGVYGIAYPILAAKGFKGVIYTIPESIGSAGTMDSAQMQDIYVAGWDLALHGQADATGYWNAVHTQAEIEAEIEQCQDYLTGIGATRAIYHAAYPAGLSGGDSDAALAACSILTARGVKLRPQSSTIDQPYQLSISSSISRDTVWTTIKATIDNAVSAGCQSRLLFHQIADVPGGDAAACPTSLFQTIVDYVTVLGVPVKTITEWYA